MNWGVFAEEWARATLRDPGQHFRARTKRMCTICGFRGYFIAAASRPEARCPNCSSKERDRVIALALKRRGLSPEDKRILHFSAERPFWRQWRRLPGYVAGDIKRSKVANATVDITSIEFPDDHFDWLVCNHVLEHVVADRQAMQECHRVLKPGGLALFSVPLSEKPETWEPPPGMRAEEVDRIAGWDHKRIYGRDDFTARLASAGFAVSPIEYTDEEARTFRLNAEGGLGPDVVFEASKTSHQ